VREPWQLQPALQPALLSVSAVAYCLGGDRMLVTTALILQV